MENSKQEGSLRGKLIIAIAIASIFVIGVFSTTTVYGAAKLPSELPETSQAPFKIKVIKSGNLIAFAKPLYTTFGDPSNYVTPQGTPYDGVGDLILTRSDGTVRCTGALLPTGKHVLTAAHCVTDDRGRLNFQSGTVTFEGTSGDSTISIVSATAHNKWRGDILRGNDIAVLELAAEAPAEITRYQIDRNELDDLVIGDKSGYGRSGNGNVGDVLPSGTKRDGQNLYDDTASTMYQALRLNEKQYFADGILQYDFDNGLAANDAFGFFFGNSQLGLGNPEVSSAPGDSGGPTFTPNISDGVITGVTSYGIRLQFNSGASSDFDGALNSSFGEFSADTRVSKFASFIDEVMAGGGSDDDGPNSCPPGKAKKNLC